MKIQTLGPSARVVMFKDGLRVLVSYETPVAAIMPDGSRVQSEQFYSRTTSKHIGQFFKDDGSARVTRSTVSESVLRALLGDR